MGVKDLWRLFNKYEEGEEVDLSECSKEWWAIDLSVWIMHGSTAVRGEEKTVDSRYMVRRTVFYRTLCLLRNGIQPIFVMDSTTAPEVKSQTLSNRRRRLFEQSKREGNERFGLEESNDLCKAMLEAMGLTVITSPGEAEKTCAALNTMGIVDACLTDDSDIFLYGAKKAYTKFDMKKKTVEKHTLSDIEDKLKLSRRDLVTMALFCQSDYGKGVKGMGAEKTKKLLSAIKQYSGDEDIVERVCGWRENKDLQDLAQKQQQMSKTTHCSKCKHAGHKKDHEKEGCRDCGSAQCEKDRSKPCTCDSHVIQRHKEELKDRQKALDNPDFPNKQIVKEYLTPESWDLKRKPITMPDWKSLAQELGWSHKDLMSTMIPVLVFMHLHKILPSLEGIKPVRILKNSQEKFVECFLVQWQEFEFDKWTPSSSKDVEKTPPTKQIGKKNPYAISIPQTLMNDKYPDLVKQHNRKKEDKKNTRTQTEEERIPKKRLKFEDGVQLDKSTPGPSSAHAASPKDRKKKDERPEEKMSPPKKIKTEDGVQPDESTPGPSSAHAESRKDRKKKDERRVEKMSPPKKIKTEDGVQPDESTPGPSSAHAESPKDRKKKDERQVEKTSPPKKIKFVDGVQLDKSTPGPSSAHAESPKDGKKKGKRLITEDDEPDKSSPGPSSACVESREGGKRKEMKTVGMKPLDQYFTKKETKKQH